MYAVFQNGGKQYRVNEGQIVKLEKIAHPIGKIIELKKIMLIVDKLNNTSIMNVGHPFINEKKITAEVISHGRSNKVKIIKFRRRKHSRKQQGHRQFFTEIKIMKISS